MAGIGENPSWFCTTSLAVTCLSITCETDPFRPAAKIVTNTTSARPTISAAAVTAVRCGWRIAFSRASTPVTPWKRASGAPIPRASGWTSTGARTATPNTISSAPSPSSDASPLLEPVPPKRP